MSESNISPDLVNKSDPSLNIMTDPGLMETKPHGRSAFPLGVYLTDPFEYHDHTVNIHWHREFQMIRIIRGTVMCSAGENEFPLSEGQGLFLNSGILHGFRADQPALMQELVFAPEMISDSNSEIYGSYIAPFLTQNISHLILNSGNPPEKIILDLISEISEKSSSPHILSRLQIQIALLKLWENLFPLLDQCETVSRSASAHRMMIRVRLMTDFIQRNYKERITPVVWLLRFRLQKAKELIETSDISISSAAAETGFPDSNYFSRAFRKNYGISPSKCRNNNGSF